MKILISFLTLFCSLNGFAQDYYAVVLKQKNTTYYYPQNVSFIIKDVNGSSTSLTIENTSIVEENNILQIGVPWKNTFEIYESRKGGIEVLKLSETEININKPESQRRSLAKDYEKPYLLNKQVNKSSISNNYNGFFEFSNGMLFKYQDGNVSAYQNNKEIKVVGHYLVYGNDFLLKISFAPKNGEMWYVFEKVNH